MYVMLLCDFHIHTTYSDGSVELRRTIDLFGQAAFDVIAITDHVVSGDNSIGKFAALQPFSKGRQFRRVYGAYQERSG